MSDTNDLGIFIDLFYAIQHFAERQVVQRQVVAILVIIGACWLISTLVRLLLFWRFRGWLDETHRRRRDLSMRFVLYFVRYLLFPLLGLTAIQMVRSSFADQGHHEGLLARFELLFWGIFLYRLLLAFLYPTVGMEKMRRYHYRFLAPLFGTVLFAWLLTHLIPLRRLASVVVWDGFTNPITLGALAVATVGFYFWFDGSGVAQDVARATITPLVPTERGTVEAMLILGRYVLIAIGIYAVFLVLGFDSTTLAFLTGGLSVGIGFGSKEIIGNLISGMLLLVDQSLRPGDIVEVDNHIGVVTDVGIRATTVNTLDNVELVIPNQTFMTDAVTTYTKSDQYIRILLDVETADAHSPHEVRRAMLSAAKQHPLVADSPAPTVFYLGTGDTSYLYKLAVWIEEPLRAMPIKSELYFQMFDEFSKVGIRPSTPARDIALISSEPASDNGSQPQALPAPADLPAKTAPA